MTNPFVSSYDQVFMDAFDKGIKEMPDRLQEIVKLLLDKLHETVLSDLQNYILDDMKTNIDDAIRQHAASVAGSMLANALAGDSEEISNLFGFNDWRMKHPYIGPPPTQWALIDAIAARRPDIFLDHRLAQRDVEIVELNRRADSLLRP